MPCAGKGESRFLRAVSSCSRGNTRLCSPPRAGGPGVTLERRPCSRSPGRWSGRLREPVLVGEGESRCGFYGQRMDGAPGEPRHQGGTDRRLFVQGLSVRRGRGPESTLPGEASLVDICLAVSPPFSCERQAGHDVGPGSCHLLLEARRVESRASQDEGGEAGRGGGSRRRRPRRRRSRGGWALKGRAVSGSVTICAHPLRRGSGLSRAHMSPSPPRARPFGAARAQPFSLLAAEPASEPAPSGSQVSRQASLPQSRGGQSVGAGPQATPVRQPGGRPPGRLPPALTLLGRTPGHSNQRWLRMSQAGRLFQAGNRRTQAQSPLAVSPQPHASKRRKACGRLCTDVGSVGGHRPSHCRCLSAARLPVLTSE